MQSSQKLYLSARYIVASKTCSAKSLSEIISNVFKMLYKHVKNFHKKSLFYSGFNQFQVVQNTFPITDQLNQINRKKKASRIPTFHFSTLYTTIPYDLLIQVLPNIIECVFNAGPKNKLRFPHPPYTGHPTIKRNLFSPRLV